MNNIYLCAKYFAKTFLCVFITATLCRKVLPLPASIYGEMKAARCQRSLNERMITLGFELALLGLYPNSLALVENQVLHLNLCL